MKRLLIIFLILLPVLAFGQGKPMLGEQIDGSHQLGDPVAFWLSNEGSGNKVYDLSGNGNTGTLIADTHFVPGKFGSALDFDGTGDYVLGGESPDLSGGFYTIALLVNLDVSQLTYAGIISKGDGVSNDWSIQRFSDGTTLRMYHGTTSVNFLNGWSSIVGQGWIYVVITYDTVNVRLYLNGILFDTQAQVSLPKNTVGRTLKIAASRDPIPVAGQIDHVLIYNRALSASKIAKLYREPFCMMVKDDIELMAKVAEEPAPTGGQVIIITSAIPIMVVAFCLIRRRNAA